MRVSKHRIQSIQSLRGLSIIVIFIGHTGMLFNWAELGVSVFFAMSGLLMMYNREGDNESSSLANNIQFSLRRVAKLYKLHISTMCVAIVMYILSFGGHLSKGDWLSLGLKTSLNITLLQTWFPHSSINQSLNGVAWYLSVTAFLYFTFPWIKEKIDKASIKKTVVLLMTVALVEIIVTYLVLRVVGVDSPVYTWIRYYFPVFRMVDFYAGCVLFKISSNVKNIEKGSRIKVVLHLLLCFALTYSLFLLKGVESKSLFTLNLQYSSVPVVGIACIWVALFFVNDGYLPKLIDNSVLRHMGNISGAFFLIHYVVIRACKQIIGIMDIIPNSYMKWLLFIVEFIVSFVLSEIYVRTKRRQKSE